MRDGLVELAAVAIAFVSVTALADLPPVYHVGQVTLSDTSSYFSTNQNYDRYGNKQDLCYPQVGSCDYKFQTETNSIDGKYDLDSALGVWSFGAGVDIDYADSRGPDPVYLTEKDRTNSQFDDVHFVMQKPIPLQMFRVIPEVKGTIAFNPINMNQIVYNGPGTNYYDNALTSNACDALQAGSWIVGSFPHTQLYAYVGYEYRDDQYSSLIPWQAGGLFQFHRFIFGGELDGYNSATNDQYGYGREILTDRVDGGSYKYFAADPVESDVRLNIGYSITPDLTVTGAWSNTISGQEIAIGQTFYASLAYSFDVAGGGRSRYNDDLLPRDKNGKASPHRQGQFQPSVEKYDQSLFESN